MTPSVLARACIERIQVDTGTGGLYEGSAYSIITGAYHGVATPGTLAFPYVVVSVEMSNQDAQPADGADVQMTFEVFDTLTQGDTRIDKVLARLYGDGILQNGRIPTYGFQRHRMTLPTNIWGAVGGDTYWVNQSLRTFDENVLVGTQVFRTSVSALAANP